MRAPYKNRAPRQRKQAKNAPLQKFITDYPTCTDERADARAALAALDRTTGSGNQGGDRGIGSGPPPPPPPPPVVTPPPSPRPAPGAPPAKGNTSRPESYNAVITDIGPKEDRLDANGGSAVVLFTTVATARDRNNRTCQALVRHFDFATLQEIRVGARYNSDLNIMESLRPIYFPVNSTAAVNANKRNCSVRMAQYDFVRSQTIRNKIGLAGPGPFLAVLKKDESIAAAIDLSRVSPNNIESMVLVFRKNYSQSSDVWNRAAYSQTLLKERIGRTLEPVFPTELVSAIQLVAVAPGRVLAGCRLGDLEDNPCTR
jgi:hypothetical protein